jgi:hypothetical protein
MAIKELQTRIALKYDSYSAWTTAPGKDLVLLKGEIGICNIDASSQESNVVPTVLFKVGDGTKTFAQLPWASAKAADVYGWAKSETVVLDGTTIKFKTGNTVNHTIDLSSFATDAEVKAITDPIAADVANIKATLDGTTDGTIGKTLTDLDARLDVIEGADTVTGSVAKALKDAKAYTDTREVAIKKYADQAETDAVASAKEYTDGVLAPVSKTASDAASDISAHKAASNPHNITKTTVGLGNVDNKSVATIKTEFTGAVASGNTGFAKGGDVYTAIENAKTAAATTAQSKVDALANGQVKTNTAAIADNAEAIEANTEAIETLIGSVAGDDAKSVRTIAAEETAKIVNGADTKYDTLKEIADFIMSDSTGAAKMANDITALQNIVKDGGTLEVRVDNVETGVADNAADIEVLQKLTSGYTGEKGIYNRVEAVSARAEKGITDAKTADDKAVAAGNAAKAAQDDVDALEIVVGDANSGLVKKANDTAAALAELTGDSGRIKAVEGEVSTIKALVNHTTKGNEKLRTDVNALQTLTGDSAKGNTALYNEITRVAGLVDNTTTGLAATKAIADKNKTDIGTLNSKVADIEAREARYLKDNDGYIFNCGTSATVVHVNA